VLLVDDGPAVGVDAAAGGDRPGGQRGRGQRLAAELAPFIRAARSAVTGQGQVPARVPSLVWQAPQQDRRPTRSREPSSSLAQALEGRFEDHHAELARMLLDQIDALTRQIDQISDRVSELIAQIPLPGAWTPTGPPARTRARARVPPCSQGSPGWTRSPAAGSSRPRRTSRDRPRYERLRHARSAGLLG